MPETSYKMFEGEWEVSTCMGIIGSPQYADMSYSERLIVKGYYYYYYYYHHHYY